MLNDLTFEMCVPSFLWIDAQRMQRKTPSWETGQRVDGDGGGV
jgi:hypothetical protein